jgi:hypothetical protein
MSALQLLLLVYGGLTALATFVVYSVCILAGRSEQSLRRAVRMLERQPAFALQPQVVAVSRRSPLLRQRRY